MSGFTESVVEEAALEWFAALGYAVVGGPTISPGEPGAERDSFSDVVLAGRLREALARLNPKVSPEGIEGAFRKLTRISSLQLPGANQELLAYLVNGVSVEYLRADGAIGYDPVRVVDYGDTCENDWLVVNPITVIEGAHNRCPDIVVFLNGLPLTVVALKNAASENATVWNAFQQLQTYKHELPGLVGLNELLVVSDGLDARVGTLSSSRERFLQWRTRGGTAPHLSDCSNILVMADDAHRSQYDFIDGFARHIRDALPNASFIGFTGTPNDAADKSTRSVFGEYVSIYDIQRAVEDGATGPILYESRLAKIQLKEEERPMLDEAFDELTEGEALEAREKLKTKWSALEDLVGTERRMALIADDLMRDFEARLEVLDGKAMLLSDHWVQGAQ